MGRFPAERWAVLVDQDHRVLGRVALTFRVWHEEGAWQALCSELRVPSFGESPGEALDAVVDATLGYLNEIEDQGERERIFAERGVHLRAGEPADGSASIEEQMALGESVSRLDFGLTVVA